MGVVHRPKLLYSPTSKRLALLLILGKSVVVNNGGIHILWHMVYILVTSLHYNALRLQKNLLNNVLPLLDFITIYYYVWSM